MAKNFHIKSGVRSEQLLYENLVIESLKIYGQEVYYLPRDIVNENKIFGDDVPSRFNSSYKIEMFIENVEGFEGEGDLFTKFGVEIRDEATFVVSRRRWGETVGRYEYKPPHPQAQGYFRKSLQWYETNGHKLKRFHLLGGEPFFMKETIPVLDTLAKVKNRNLEFNIISNMMCTPARLEMYIDKIEKLIRDKNIGRFDLTVSIDGIGPEAEYCRSGMKTDVVTKNMNYIINKKWIIVNVNSVMTSLTIKPYLALIRYVNEKRKIRRIGQYFAQDIGTRNFLHPMAQGGEFWREDMLKLINEIEDYDGRSLFKNHLIGIWKSFEKTKPNKKLINKMKFYLDELDRRRNTNWRKIYPYLDI